MSAREFIRKLHREQRGRKLSAIISQVSQESGVPRGSLRNHVLLKTSVLPKTAARLERWSKGRISAVKTLGMAG